MFGFLFFIITFTHGQSNSKRVLEIYTTNVHNPAYLQQLQLLSGDEPGWKERDLVVEKFVLGNDNSSRFKNKKIKGDFAVLLIGKDGGEKYRSAKPVTLDKLYTLIDSMPMRQEEMKRNK